MLNNPATRYRPFAPIALADRTWPSKTITIPPIWMSTDLRDGNQALFEPMNVERKLRMFQTLVEVGFKEIEVAFPAASETDFGFVRTLIEQNLIPHDVTIEVLTPARDELIERSMEALRGARRAIIHLYNATSPNFRQIVFGLDQAGVKAIAIKGAQTIKRLAAAQPDTEWVFQYSPETFTGTELPFAKEVCDAVIDIWEATPQRKVIINLPATVELASPNIYADQVEWMSRNLARRDSVIISLHPHNDRGTAVAAAELGMMAGADRVEGCLFGNGERTGNVDLVTLALNMYSQGVHPGLDFSNINEVARIVEHCTQLPIHPRHPYVGDLVFTAFSGSHQDAIKKGMAVQSPDGLWEVPYLPLDPADLGRTYDSIIRVNSQSGKGGIAFLLEAEYGMVMPRRLQVEFSTAVQSLTEQTGGEVVAADIWTLFSKEYFAAREPVTYVGHRLFDHGQLQGMHLSVTLFGQPLTLSGEGNGPIDALLHALRVQAKLHSYEERAMGQGADATAVTFAEVVTDGVPGTVFGVGMHANIVTASVLAVISGLNRIYAKLPEQEQVGFFRQREQVSV